MAGDYDAGRGEKVALSDAMKVCPFCKEEIREEAIKCRYCMSSLLPPQPQPEAASEPRGAAKNTVYILDEGLVRFGKFAAGILAIFIAVGIYLYGVDIKEALKDVESSSKAARDSAQAVKDSADKVKADSQKAQDDLKAAEATAKSALDQTQASVGALQEQVVDVQAKQDETSKAAIKAQAAEKNIELAQKQMTDVQKNLGQLVVTAQDLAAKIEAAKQEADTAVAHIKEQLPGHETSAEDTHPGLTPETGAPPTPDKGFTVPELAALYKFPTQFKGTGQTIGLIELGGGYRPGEIAKYFQSIGIPMPKLTSVSVSGAQNSPTVSTSSDGQVQLDIEVAGAVAPGAHIVVYFCPNTNSGFLAAINAAINNRESPTTVISISWGGPEPNWTSQFIQQMNAAFQSAAQHGITVLAAAGDNGPTDGLPNGKLAVDFPASSPWVTSVGGTHIHASAAELQSELVWDDGSSGGATGGGVSSVFPIPDWQATAGVPKGTGGFAGRGVPDVAADASPNTGYHVQIDGTSMILGGTAAATPLWAGLIALLNEGAGQNIGFFNPVLYEKLGPASVLRTVTSKNGSNPGKPSWNPQTGWGSPNGEKLLQALKNK